ncbi:MAG: glycosyltransferase, partial [Fimbriiglobus sp.]
TPPSDTATPMNTPMTKFLFWPPTAITWNNPYLRLFHAAMARHGVDYAAGFRPRADFVRENAGTFSGIHIHWPESMWRTGGRWAVVRQARQVVRLARLADSLRVARRTGYRVVWTVHNSEHHEGATWADRVGYWLLRRGTDLFVFHSVAARDAFTGGATGQTAIMPIGSYDGVYPPPAPRAETLARLGIPAGRRILLCAGLIRRYKGFELAVDAVRWLGPEYHLIIAGPPHDPTLAAELAGPSVTVVARDMPDQEFADVHGAADCVLLPYRKITGSSALLAALALGRGVVASDLPFFCEYLPLEPLSGELFPPGDPAGLAAAIERFFGVLLAERHAAARRLADRFSWDAVAEPLAATILAMCGRKDPEPVPGGRS